MADDNPAAACLRAVCKSVFNRIPNASKVHAQPLAASQTHREMESSAYEVYGPEALKGLLLVALTVHLSVHCVSFE